ncbi:hypothetical protein [Bradyrhizobium sp. CCBAU 53338]|uniref:hypothetical protein n=1 Tax=Bradyrhizobium sp. CCBAU 53338 TaxID=1325111 RepID=UPI00188A83F0|nr:hypothetical protein [Bradyrhizobium sp. CCBAU 53338]
MSESFEATEETVLVSYRSGTLTSAIFSYANYENEELRRICIHLHNAKQIDLLELVHSDEFNSVSNTSFFAGQKFFDDVLPELTASVPAMMRCVKSLVDRGGRDLAANFPLESFRAWCGRDLERAREVISIAQSNEEAANGFLTAALIVGNYEEDARYFALG